VGAEYTGDLYSKGSDSTCTVTAQTEGSRLFQTTSVPSAEFHEASESVDMTAPGRLKPRYNRSDDGGCWFKDFWDSELSTPCGFMELRLEQYRCLPSDYTPGIALYSDAACTQTVPGWVQGTCGITGPPRYVTRSAGGRGQCDDSVDGYSVSEIVPFTGTAYEMQSGACAPVPDGTAYQFEAVTLDLFVGGTVTVE
jgi:hypothetical protein